MADEMVAALAELDYDFDIIVGKEVKDLDDRKVDVFVRVRSGPKFKGRFRGRVYMIKWFSSDSQPTYIFKRLN